MEQITERVRFITAEELIAYLNKDPKKRKEVERKLREFNRQIKREKGSLPIEPLRFNSHPLQFTIDESKNKYRRESD